MIPRRLLADMIESRDLNAITEPALSAQATEKTEANEPIEPTDNMEPTEPIDSIEPFDAIDRNESSDHKDRREPLRTSGQPVSRCVRKRHESRRPQRRRARVRLVIMGGCGS